MQEKRRSGILGILCGRKVYDTLARMKGSSKDNDKRDALLSSALTESQKKKDEIIADAMKWGHSRQEALRLWSIIKGTESSGGSSAPSLTRRTLSGPQLSKPALPER